MESYTQHILIFFIILFAVSVAFVCVYLEVIYSKMKGIIDLLSHMISIDSSTTATRVNTDYILERVMDIKENTSPKEPKKSCETCKHDPNITPYLCRKCKYDPCDKSDRWEAKDA